MSETSALRRRNDHGKTVYRFRTTENYQEGSGEPPDTHELWKGFKDITSAHGVPQINRAKGPIKRIFWSVCLFGCIVGFFYNFVSLCILYNNFLVSVKVQLLHNREMPFPAVTICNSNPVKSSAVYNSPRLVALLQSWGVPLTNGSLSRKKRDLASQTDDIPHRIHLSQKVKDNSINDKHQQHLLLSKNWNLKYKLENERSNSLSNTVRNQNLVHHQMNDYKSINKFEHHSDHIYLNATLERQWRERSGETINVVKHRTKRSFTSDSSCTDLSYTYAQYKAISGNNDVPHNTIANADACKALCTANALCKSADYEARAPASRCMVSYADQYTASLVSVANFDYYEKCTGCNSGFPTPDNSQRTCTLSFPNWQATYTCNGDMWWNADGLKTKTITCSCATETWETITDVCVVKADCATAAPDLTAYGLGKVNSPGVKHGSIQVYGCLNSYTFYGSAYQAICLNGFWQWYPLGSVNGYCTFPRLTFYTDYLGYKDASRRCQSDGGNLVVINNKAKYDKVHHLLSCRQVVNNKRGSYRMPWIGLLYDHKKSKTWKWVTGQEVNYTNWLPGQPNDLRKEFCTRIINKKGEWANRKCGRKSNYICERVTTGPCYSNPCLNEGSCCSVDEAVVCKCKTPFTGERCEKVQLTTPFTTLKSHTDQHSITPIPAQNITTKVVTTAAATTEAETTVAETTTTTTPETTTTTPTSTEAETTAAQTSVAETSTASTSAVETTSQSSTTPAASKYAERNENPLREDFKKEEDIMRIFAELDENIKKDLGYTYHDMMVDCQYEGRNCGEGDFDYFFDAVHGNCYVFNAGWSWSSNKSHYYSHRAGRRFGLKVVINIGQAEYLQGVGEAAGAVVVVHSPKRMPFPEDEGVLAEPGSGTAIGVKMIEVNRLNSPYGDECVDNTKQNITRNVFEELYPINYSSNACFKTCYQRHVIKKCGCADPQYPMYGTAFGRADILACDIRNIEQDDCKYGITQQYIRNELDCHCPNPCHDTAFVYSVSSMRWPADKHENKLLDSFGSSLDKLRSSNDSSVIRRNLLKLEVYFEEFNYEKIQEFPTYPLTKLFSDIGGIIGLWIGCSVLSIAELFELLVDLIILGCYKLTKKPYWANPPKKRPSTYQSENSGLPTHMQETNLSQGNESNFTSRRNSMANYGKGFHSNYRTNYGEGIRTGINIPGVIIEDCTDLESSLSQTGNGRPPEITKKDSYIKRAGNLVRGSMTMLNIGAKRKSNRSPPPRNNNNRSSLPTVEGGLRANLNAVYDDDIIAIDDDSNAVRRRGQFSEENPPFKFI